MCSRYSKWTAGVLVLALVCAADAQEKPNPLKPEAKAAKDKMISAGEIAGKIIDLNLDERQLTVQVHLRYLVPNPDGVATHQQLQQEYVDALQLPDPAERFQRLREIQIALLQNQPNLVMVKEEQHDVPVQFGEELKVRLTQPPQAFDDKGNPRKYTAEELKALKGDENLVGYRGALQDLRTNQLVRVYLVRKIPAKPDPAARLTGPPPVQAALVVILAELPQQ
jgi:hypothetical protein